MDKMAFTYTKYSAFGNIMKYLDDMDEFNKSSSKTFVLFSES